MPLNMFFRSYRKKQNNFVNRNVHRKTMQDRVCGRPPCPPLHHFLAVFLFRGISMSLFLVFVCAQILHYACYGGPLMFHVPLH